MFMLVGAYGGFIYLSFCCLLLTNVRIHPDQNESLKNRQVQHPPPLSPPCPPQVQARP